MDGTDADGPETGRTDADGTARARTDGGTPDDADLRIAVDGRELTARWTDDAPTVRDAVAAALPLSGDARRWGDELYVQTPVDVDGENAVETVPVGAVAYWPRGSALCLFWGPTPASVDGEPRAASPVSVVAQVADVAALADLQGGAQVRVERVGREQK